MKSEDDEITTLTHVSNSIEAHLMKGRLESCGIPCFIADDNMVSINPLYSNLIGGIRVRVRKFDLVEAREILGLPKV
jgi:hypothetical protein